MLACPGFSIRWCPAISVFSTCITNLKWTESLDCILPRPAHWIVFYQWLLCVILYEAPRTGQKKQKCAQITYSKSCSTVLNLDVCQLSWQILRCNYYSYRGNPEVVTPPLTLDCVFFASLAEPLKNKKMLHLFKQLQQALWISSLRSLQRIFREWVFKSVIYGEGFCVITVTIIFAEHSQMGKEKSVQIEKQLQKIKKYMTNNSSECKQPVSEQRITWKGLCQKQNLRR